MRPKGLGISLFVSSTEAMLPPLSGASHSLLLMTWWSNANQQGEALCTCPKRLVDSLHNLVAERARNEQLGPCAKWPEDACQPQYMSARAWKLTGEQIKAEAASIFNLPFLSSIPISDPCELVPVGRLRLIPGQGNNSSMRYSGCHAGAHFP